MTTADDFTETARAEAEARYPVRESRSHVVQRSTFRTAAVWARDHLAAREETDAEVEAAVQAIWEARSLGEPMEVLSAGHFEELEYEARAALVAARAVRQEKR